MGPESPKATGLPGAAAQPRPGPRHTPMTPYLLVSRDFIKTGGMDRANYALASYLARQGREVHLVAYGAGKDLLAQPNVTLHRVPKLAGSYSLSEPLLDRVGRYWASHISARGGRVLVNGGNCLFGDVNWVHYVHTAYAPQPRPGMLRRLKSRWSHRTDVAREHRAMPRARLVVADSERTRRDVTTLLGIAQERVSTVYYGVDRELFRPAPPEARAAVRAQLGWRADQLVVAFIGVPGDHRKGFDTLFAAWQRLCADDGWDVDLAVIGAAPDLPAWKARAAEAGIGTRVHFLGFRRDVPDLLKACDALVSPTRYEAYGLAVHEALCCGLPAFVSRSAGVAERYPAELRDLLLADPEDSLGLAQRLRAWKEDRQRFQDPLRPFSERLRAYSWDHMAADMVQAMENMR